MLDEINPYESPRLADDIGSQTGEIMAELVRRRWVYRKIQLLGTISATVEYSGHGAGYETVYVNGVEAARSQYRGLQQITHYLCPEIPFTIAADGIEVPAKVEIRATFYLTLAAFRLWIGDRVVYSEGFWPA